MCIYYTSLCVELFGDDVSHNSIMLVTMPYLPRPLVIETL